MTAFALNPAESHAIDSLDAMPVPTPEKGYRSHAADLSWRLARDHGVDVHAMLRTGTFGDAVIARARLCGELAARGWSAEEIEAYYAMPEGWAERGVARWERWNEAG